MSVPFLVYHGINMRHAIATSAAIGLPIALAGSLSYVVSGWQNQQLPDASLGYVHIPSLLGIVISSVLFAPVGAALAHKLPINQLKKIFALLLVLMAGKLLFSEF